MDAFSKLPEAINELVSEFSSAPVVGDLGAGITQYSFWLFVSAIVLLVVVFTFVKKQTLVPKGLFVNGVEYLVEYVENDVAKGVVGTEWRKHFPFLATIFFFIYFVYFGCKKHGVIGYLKSLAPAGVAFPMNVFVWVIEVFSLLLRPITLAIRLFCNMFAGHIVMGSFAIMASLFAQPLLEQVSAMNALGALPSLAWVAILLIIYAVELIVAFVQAYVFTVLAAVYIQIAEAEGH